VLSQSEGREKRGEMKESEKNNPPEMLETQLGPEGVGLPPIPDPGEWPSEYGIDEAVALAVVPERALVFWELAKLRNVDETSDPRITLTRLRLEGEIPVKELSADVEHVGRYQDSTVSPGKEYVYVLSRVEDGEEIPMLVTNPIRMPIRTVPETVPGAMPSSFGLAKGSMKRAIVEEE